MFLKNSEPRVFKVHLKLIGTGIYGDLGPQIQVDSAIQFWPNFEVVDAGFKWFIESNAWREPLEAVYTGWYTSENVDSILIFLF